MLLPLSGIKVLDLTHALAGPYASMILGDFGAEVVKVEASPKGDLLRGWGIKLGESSTYSMSANRNKKGILLNYRAPGALELLKELAVGSDVILENFRPGVMDDLGLSYETLKKLNPRLIYGKISGYGESGPKSNEPGFDIVAQACSGLMSINGSEESGPLRVGVPIGDLGAGMWLAMGVFAALRQRDMTGEGQIVETSLLSTLINMLGDHSQTWLSKGRVSGLTGNTHPAMSPYGAYRASDATMIIAPGSQSLWLAFCDVIGLHFQANDNDFSTPQARTQNSAQLKLLIEERLASDTAVNWTRKLVKAGVPAGPIYDVSQALEDEQVQSCGLVESVAHPELGLWKVTANPVRLSANGNALATRLVPPRPGEHTVQCLSDYGLSREKIQELLSAGIIVQASN